MQYLYLGMVVVCLTLWHVALFYGFDLGETAIKNPKIRESIIAIKMGITIIFFTVMFILTLALYAASRQ